MCGIAGFVSALAPTEKRESAVGAMCTAMHHRGPDDHGFASRHEATLGSCRLAIFDPANGGQPMYSPDGRFTIVFNGAIYNFRELRAELAPSWSFKTDCDTEVLLAAYARWGTDCLDRLRGMFAFAVWDDHDRKLVLARDPFGIKPLYFQHRNGLLLFASELNALLASGEVSADIDPRAVADYLAWFTVPAPRTIYRNIVSLRPGEFACYAEGRLSTSSAWSFSRIKPAAPIADYREFVQHLRRRLEDTIRAHMLADVPVGAFLSGGLDSAAVVGLMTRLGGAKLRTFSIGFEETQFSESAAAEETARHFGAIHRTHILTGSEIANDLDKLLDALDQPTGDGVNTYYASQLARQGGVTVALSGLGGDELFGGYPAFRDTPALARLLPYWNFLPALLRTSIREVLERGDTRQRKLADVLRDAANIHEVGALQRRVFSESMRQSLLSDDVNFAAGAMRAFHPQLGTLAADVEGAREFDIVSAWELRTYMADVLLRDSDVMSMRHSLELRVPLVDRPLIEWLWNQPLKESGRSKKSALYDAVADILPPGLANRKKHGFTLPFPIWMKRELRPFLEETFSNASVGRNGLFASDRVQKLWQGFLHGNDTREWSRVWTLAILVAFTNRRPAPVRAASSSSVTVAPSVRTTHTLLLAPEIYASEGGIPRILQTYLRALCETAEPGRRIRLVALNDTVSAAAKAYVAENAALEVSRACSRNKSRFVRQALNLARGCDTLVCGHIHQLPVAWLAKRLNPKLRYFLVAHGIEVWRPFTPTEKTALRGAERILCVSDFTRAELERHCPLPEGKAVVLHNALDPVFSIDGGRPLRECPPRILVVTRLTQADRYKGVQHLVEAMPAIHAAIPNATLRIIGRGDDRTRLEELAAQLGMADAIEFTGYVDDARVSAEMRTCRLFALPSRKEGFGLVFLEAMAHGRPCLGAQAGGVPEVITPETGVLINYGDVDAIARAAIDALRRDWDEAAIVARAREFSFEAFKRRLATHLSA